MLPTPWSWGVALACLVLLPQAHAVVTFDWATVANPGNAPDTQVMFTDFSSGYGPVGYTYQISRHEVTNAQYTEFLNAAAADDPYSLYNPEMGAGGFAGRFGGILRSGSPGSYTYTVKSGYADLPVVYVSWNDAARFVNWLHNGQGTAGTENGVYDMSLPAPSRAADATFVIPNENEWYKAAYYDPDLDGSPGYWDYATGTDSVPYSDDPAALNFPANSANYHNFDGNANNGYNDGYALPESAGALTPVGGYFESLSAYGTFDQSGNVREWNESFIYSGRGLRGGMWLGGADFISAAYRDFDNPVDESALDGFRVALVFPGDLDGDGDADLDDYELFAGCMSGSNVTVPPPGCDPAEFEAADLNEDSDVDLQDFELWEIAFPG